MDNLDYYAVLGVPINATSQHIKDRFRFLSHAYHPDKFPSHLHKVSAESEFKRINEAYTVLSDLTQRRRYDASYTDRQKASETKVPFQVLDRITYFAAPPYPWQDCPVSHELHDAQTTGKFQPQQIQHMRMLIECETYDARVISKAPVPPTKVDTLVCDLWALATNEIGISATSPVQLTSDDLAQAIRIYDSTPWKKIRGYRPWTHWHFVNRLNSEEREALAREAHTYMLKNGIKNGQ